MKKSKILIPTLSALAISPAIALSSCGQDTSYDIINAIIDPTKLTETVKVDNIKSSFKTMNDAESQKEIIYDLFGMCNLNNEGNFSFEKSLTKMWQENIVSFKTNISKCYLNTTDNEIKATFLGYVSFVFNQEVKATYFPSTEMTFKANDYIMYTYDFVNANVTVSNDGTVEYTPKTLSIMGFYKIRCNGDEFMIRLPNPSTYGWNVKNSHNWVQK